MEGGVQDFDKTARTMQQWRTAYDIATRMMREGEAALEEYYELPGDVMVLVRLRLQALRGLPFKLED
jgi:hypothetical protein